MIQALRVVARALSLWWREFLLLTLFNLIWFTLQIPIVTGPPATAAMYAIARRVTDGELIELQQAGQALRQMLVPAWQWGAVNLLIVAAIVGNFWFYQNAQGFGWMILRLLWGLIALVWFAMNLFYWPFWLAQSDRRMSTTFRNSFVCLAKTPAFAFTLALIGAGLISASVLLTLPLVVALMAWLALIGVLAVDEEIGPREAMQNG